MEDILDLYACPEDPEHPVVCVDETSKQHLQQTRPPLRLTVGKPYRYDSEYKRNGVSNLFMIFAPLDGFRHVEVTDQRRSIDFAHICRDIVDVHFPERIAEKLEFHYTPKHGSWLNMAEIEFSVLKRQCLSRRIPDQQTLKREVQAWQNRRNQQCSTVHWRFTTQDARIKLKKLYPSSND